MADFNKIGKTIRQLREEKEMSQPQLVIQVRHRGCKLSQGNLSRMERGLLTSYPVSLLGAIAESLSVATWELLK